MIETERLIMRRRREDDMLPFAVINSDSEVMERLKGARFFYV